MVPDLWFGFVATKGYEVKVVNKWDEMPGILEDTQFLILIMYSFNDGDDSLGEYTIIWKLILNTKVFLTVDTDRA